MHNFEKRRDRYELFAAFEKPLVNVSFDMSVPDFRPYCRERKLPPFHFFLYCILNSIKEIDNFMYRVHDGEVIRIEQFQASYTVLNKDNNLNFASFDMSSDLQEFVARSLAAKAVAEASGAMLNSAREQSEREQKNNVHITCMPWFKLTSIEHPVYRHGSYDIPSLAWGKFGDAEDGKMTIPFSVQAHHGFVDGYHIHLLAEAIAARVARLILN
jgi:chloramphenicol O-acetyltransferase type A